MSEPTKISSKPDAFKARMAAAQADGRPELPHQCRGRPFTEAEQNFAVALMSIYADGVKSEVALAEALGSRGVLRPSSQQPDWTAENITSELKGLNADFDEAYQQNGFGA